MERIVVGVDLAAGRGVTAMAALRLTTAGPDTLTTLSLLSLTHLADDEAILAEIARVAPSIIGIDAPLSLPAPITAALRGSAPPDGVSPYTRAAERDPMWSQLGVRPFPVSFLAGLTFRAIPLAARLRAQQPAAQIIEVFPSATLAALGLASAEPPEQRHVRKTTPERRRATQATLARYIAGLPTPPNDAQPLDADSLDALLAALTCAAATLEASQALGDPAEGCIILPAHNASGLFALNTVSKPTR
jgi:predicted nuclease with RNAse H fold